ncbi:hypothetical protein [Pseudomonas syringae]|uniref:hypothetical protein n=1 Tax=Pseudomonas syringae TaxID=317 RepID=UPI0012B03C6B|nr:hypothetical protein [Pseudomonas syringae]
MIGKKQKPLPYKECYAPRKPPVSLDVTPIVNDKGVLRDVILSKDEPDYSNTMNGVLPINTTSLTSRFFSPFGQTIALGGVYSDLDTTVVKACRS